MRERMAGGSRGILGARRPGAVRKEGIEPSRELPHRNLKGQCEELSSRNHMHGLVSDRHKIPACGTVLGARAGTAITPARKRLLRRMWRLSGGLFAHELCDHDLRIMLRMLAAGLVAVEEAPEGALYTVRVIKGGRAA